MIPQLVTKTQQITEEILGRMGIPAEVMVEVGVMVAVIVGEGVSDSCL